MADIPDDLNGAKALNICRTRDGWQASLEVEAGTFRFSEAETPSLAIDMLFGPPLPETMEEFLASRPITPPPPVKPISAPPY